MFGLQPSEIHHGMSSAWYHHDISRVQAEDLLAKAGKDGSFLVRASESVPGAYALCLLFQHQVHTYRILTDEEGFLTVQTSQGLQVKFFRTLNDLVSVYQQPNKGLVIPLLYPVGGDPGPAEGYSGVSVEGEDKRVGIQGMSDDDLMSTVNNDTSWPPVPLHRNYTIQKMQLQLEDQLLSSPGNEFLELMADYVRNCLQLDLAALTCGTPTLRHLSRALGVACHGLHSEIDLTMTSLETLGKVFDHPASPTNSEQKQTPPGVDPDLEQLIDKISSLSSLLTSLEKKVLKALQETASSLASPNLTGPGSPAPSPTAQQSDGHKFEVRIGKTQKATLMVELEKGQVGVFKKGLSTAEETITQEHILQLVKFQSEQSKVRLVYGREQQKNLSRDFFFQNAKKREAFCQLLQLMKMKHSALEEPDLITIYIGTWNMGSSLPPRSVASWLTTTGLGFVTDESTAALPHDFYVIGTQENSLGDREWVDFLRGSLKAMMGIDYKAVAVQSLWSIKMAVLVRPEHERRISHITAASVKTGIANTLGNKGAVGVSFLFNGTSFGFVNCHLASGSEKTSRRNQNYLDILRSLAIGDRKLGVFDISLRFNHLFWFGDLNYRLDMEVQDVLNHVNKKEFTTLMAVDQLNTEREKNKVFLRFNEEEITFPPTYRYERGTRDTYNCYKCKSTGLRINAPSWCDRVLWKSHPESHIMCTSYGCTDNIVTSDHSPVFATFEVGVTSQFLSKKDPSNSTETPACIEFESVEAIIKTSSRNKFFIEIHSYCLEEYQKSAENVSHSSEVTGFLKLAWSRHQLPQLHPILPDMEYLLDQHLLLTIKSSDGYESYGECCIAMRSMIGSVPQQFETFLSHRGEETGSMRGWMRVQVPRDRRGTRERLYELISLEKDNEETKPLKSSNDIARPRQRAERVRPFSVPNSSSSYTNPEYFIFEGVQTPTTPSHSCAKGSFSPSITKSPKEQPELVPPSPGHLPRGSNETQAQGMQVLEKQLPRIPHFCLPRGVSPQGKPFMRQKPSRQKRPNSVTIISDSSPSKATEEPSPIPQTQKTPESSTRGQPLPAGSTKYDEDHSLTALHMAKCLSELDSQIRSGTLVTSRQKQGVSKNLLRHTYSALGSLRWAHIKGNQLPDHAPTCVRRRQLSGGYVNVKPRTIGQWLSRFGLEQYEEALHQKGWDNFEFFRSIVEQDLVEAGVVNATHRKLILANLREI